MSAALKDDGKAAADAAGDALTCKPLHHHPIPPSMHLAVMESVEGEGVGVGEGVEARRGRPAPASLQNDRREIGRAHV